MAKKAIATIPAKVTDMTMMQAISSFNDHETKIYKELSDYIRKHNKENINWYWDLGVRLSGIRNDAKKNKEHYGKGILERMCVALGFKTTGPLYKAMDVVEAFGTKKAFLEYTKLAGEAGNTLTWGHIVVLSGVSDVSMRLELAGTALEQAWSVDRLGEQVRKLVDRKARGIRKAKPKAKIPGSVKKCLQHVTARAEEFIYQFKTAWTGDAFDLAGEVDDLPTSNLNDKLLEDLGAARERVKELIDSATQMETELANADKTVRRKLAAQAEADEAAACAAAAAEIEEEYDNEEEAVDDEDSPSAKFEFDFEPADAEEAEEEEEEDEDEESVNLGAQRNAIAREKRALARARERAKKARAR